ncbi:F-type H+-transporting ATPase subunit a [Pseudochelatococcus lubricantis]|uniref:ATP synthase subunit a n=1 Tax=Pseudochelatococcus lubricantis TaxID=1538102 RepID=A0ABX0UWE4_9HYPH|nr:F0F1 ATP synthase subunit A [Pseudochelatococcus lubricantis]NIJ57277.1 F-type H+-transporting ATPase subunit a [Pseudochelatococcus lubricantis]
MASPTEQFEIRHFTGPLFHLGDSPVTFTNSALFMVLAVGVITAFLAAATAPRAVVPGRWQNLGELLYEFVASTVRQSAGKDGLVFLPLVFSLFTFVLIANLLGLLPYAFTVTSHIIVTAALALLVIFTVIGYGVAKHGAKFLNIFVPSGVPGWLLPLIVAIEVVSFISRPVSLSVRLFANMLAGHIALKIFAGFVAALLAGGFAAFLSPLPLAFTVALTALEVLVAVLQAYVFAVLTSLYLHDALHPGH